VCCKTCLISGICPDGKNVALQFGQIRKSIAFISMRTGSSFPQNEQLILATSYALTKMSRKSFAERSFAIADSLYWRTFSFVKPVVCAISCKLFFEPEPKP
jgi:hypothetical protein